MFRFIIRESGMCTVIIIIFLSRPSPFYMFSNVSILLLVLPFLTSRRVLNLSLPLNVKNIITLIPEKIIIIFSNLCQVLPVEPVLRRLLRHLVSQVGAELLKMSKFKLIINFIYIFCAKIPLAAPASSRLAPCPPPRPPSEPRWRGSCPRRGAPLK